MSVDAATAAALRRDVTIVVSPKDWFSGTLEQWDALRARAPGIRILHVLTGPMPREVRDFIEERARRDPDLELLDSGIDFGNPYALRNLALTRVRTRYVMFMFNDVRPQNDGWLAELVRCAERRPEADIFQPFIWEGSEAPHASWKWLQFLRHEGELHCIQPIGAVGKQPAPVDAPPEQEQPCYLEDHAFLARTAFLAAHPVMDPWGAYAKEFLDLALSVRFSGSRIWSVPASQVLYAVPYRMAPGDLLYFSHRRSWRMCRASVEYIQRKWGFRYRDDAYSVLFGNAQLASASFTGARVPPGQLEQVEMMLGLFAAIGYDSFEPGLEGGAAEAAPLELAAAHRQIKHALSAGERRIDWTMRHASAVASFADFTADFPARRRAVAEGRLFTVREHPRAKALLASRGPEQQPNPFLLLEVQGLRGSEAQILEVLAPYASLITRERGPDGQTTYRAWLQARLQQPGDLPALREALVANRGRGFKIAGNALAAKGTLIHRARGQNLRAVRVFSDAAANWRLIHCAWKPYRAAELSALLR